MAPPCGRPDWSAPTAAPPTGQRGVFGVVRLAQLFGAPLALGRQPRLLLAQPLNPLPQADRRRPQHRKLMVVRWNEK